MSETVSRKVSERLPLTSSQTVGPYLAIGLTWEDGEQAVDPGTPGAVTISGTLYDGAGEPVPDGMVEIWQAHPSGRTHHPHDPRGVEKAPAGFRGFARAQTVDAGRWSVLTVLPGAVPGPDGTTQAPHLAVSVFARGMLDRCVTRVYFPEHADVDGPGGHAGDVVLQSVPEHRRHTLVAQQVDGGYRFDIRLQGEHETVFFDI